MSRTIFLSLIILVYTMFPVSCSAGSEVWEQYTKRFESEDSVNPPIEGVVLFVGSSSIARWASLEEDFVHQNVINRGVDGATTKDLLTYFNSIVLPYAPKKIVLYCGGNDIAFGLNKEVPMQGLISFVDKVHSVFPDTYIYVMSIKPSPLRIDHWQEMERINNVRKAYANSKDKVDYVDISGAMFDESGSIRHELYLSDQLHLNSFHFLPMINT